MKYITIFVIALILSNSNYIYAVDPKESSSPIFNPDQMLFTKTVIKLRKGPGKSYAEIINIPKGRRIRIKSEAPTNEEVLHNIKSFWYPVHYNAGPDYYGWVFGGFLYKGDPFMDNANDNAIIEFLDETEWRNDVDSEWYHALKFSGNKVENFCVGECGQFGNGIYNVKNKIITIDFGANGSDADFRKENCHLFRLETKTGIFCGMDNIYYLYNN